MFIHLGNHENIFQLQVILCLLPGLSSAKEKHRPPSIKSLNYAENMGKVCLHPHLFSLLV